MQVVCLFEQQNIKMHEVVMVCSGKVVLIN